MGPSLLLLCKCKRIQIFSKKWIRRHANLTSYIFFQVLFYIPCFFLFTVVLSHVTSAAGLIHVSGYEGREAKVSCHYKEDIKSHVKYLCRNDCGDADVLIKTTIGKRSRYSISDDKRKRVFTVIISDLSFTDAGKYWCGVEIIGIDIFTEVKLNVKQGK